jgi:hypothetical protein
MSYKKSRVYRAVIIEWVTILTAVVACFAVLYSEIKGLDAKLERQSHRSDRLYEMFIDLLKDKCEKV